MLKIGFDILWSVRSKLSYAPVLRRRWIRWNITPNNKGHIFTPECQFPLFVIPLHCRVLSLIQRKVFQVRRCGPFPIDSQDFTRSRLTIVGHVSDSCQEKVTHIPITFCPGGSIHTQSFWIKLRVHERCTREHVIFKPTWNFSPERKSKTFQRVIKHVHMNLYSSCKQQFGGFIYWRTIQSVREKLQIQVAVLYSSSEGKCWSFDLRQCTPP